MRKIIVRVGLTLALSGCGVLSSFITQPELSLETKLFSLFGITRGEGRYSGAASETSLSRPQGMVRIGNDLYFSDTLAIRKINLVTKQVSLVAGISDSVAAAVDGANDVARVHNAVALATDGQDIYFTETIKSCIRKLQISTGALSTYAGLCGTSGNNGTTPVNLSTARFSAPLFLVFLNGALYVSERDANVIRKIDLASEIVSVFAGSPGVAGTTNGIGTAARFRTPFGIAVASINSADYLVVADSFFNSIRLIEVSNQTVSTLHTNPSIDPSNIKQGVVDGPANSALFWAVLDVAVDSTNNAIFISDNKAKVIRKVQYDPNDLTTLVSVSTVFGNPSLLDYKNGIGTQGTALGMNTLFLDNGTLYFSTGGTETTIRTLNVSTLASNTLVGHPPTKMTSLKAKQLIAGLIQQPVNLFFDGTDIYFTEVPGNVIRKLNVTTHTLTTLVGTPFTQGNNESADHSAITMDTVMGLVKVSGGYYISQIHSHTIRFIPNSGSSLVIAGTLNTSGDSVAGTGLFKMPRGMCVINNDLYIADQGNNRIKKISFTDINDPSAGYTIANFVGSGAAATLDGAGTTAKIQGVYRLFCAPTAAPAGIYFTEYTGHTVRYSTVGGAVTTLAGLTGTAGDISGVVGTSARFRNPYALTVQGTTLYVSDNGNYKIKSIDLANSNTVTWLAGSASGGGDGPFKSAAFSSVYDLWANNDKIYLTDFGARKIRMLDLTKGGVSTLAGEAYPKVLANGITDGSTDYAAGYHEFFDIVEVGNFYYLIEGPTGKIYKMNDSGQLTHFAGVGTEKGNFDGPLLQSVWTMPYFATTLNGNIYVTDYVAKTVRKIDLQAGTVSTLAGSPGETGTTNGIGSLAKFTMPYQITTDGTSLFVADSTASIIRQINPDTQEVTTLIGLVNSTGLVDGDKTTAKFNTPYGITYFKNALYVTDSSNQNLRKIDISDINNPIVTTVAGSATSVFGNKDGIGTAALFNVPTKITHDDKYLYIMDRGNNSIRRFDPATNTVSTWLGVSDESRLIDGPLNTARLNYPQALLFGKKKTLILDQDGWALRELR